MNKIDYEYWLGQQEITPDHAVYFDGISGSFLNNSGSVCGYPLSIQEIPINLTGIQIYKCMNCGRKTSIDYGKVKTIFVLECLSCGSQNMELMR